MIKIGRRMATGWFSPLLFGVVNLIGSVRAEEPISSSHGDWLCSLPRLYSGSNEAAFQSLDLKGIIHLQYAHVDARQGTADECEFRRLRFGIDSRFLNHFLFRGRVNFDPDGEQFYQNLSQVFVSYSPDGNSKESLERFRLSLGKLRPRFSGEYEISAKNLKTFERSLLANQLAPSRTAGVLVGGEDRNWDYLLGLFAGENSPEFSWFDEGALFLAKVGYSPKPGLRFGLDYLGVSGEQDVTSNIDHALSLSAFYNPRYTEGKWIERDDVWIYSTAPGKEKGALFVGFGKGSWFGPELGFGKVIGDEIDEPVLIIKTAWGGHSLGIKFRPPSSGQPKWEKTKFKKEDVGTSYREMMKIIKEVSGNLETHFPHLKGHKVEFAGFGWHQGWNHGGSAEMVSEYGENMANLIKDVRKELKADGLPFVVANTGMIGGGGKGIRDELCEIQLSLGDPGKFPEFKGTVAAVDTRSFKRGNDESPSGFGYHWNHNAESHWLVGESMGRAMVDLLKRK